MSRHDGTASAKACVNQDVAKKIWAGTTSALISNSVTTGDRITASVLVLLDITDEFCYLLRARQLILKLIW